MPFSPTDWRKIADEGRTASASMLEQAVNSDPEDVVSRVKLVGYYSVRPVGSYEDHAKRNTHILWLIKNRPDIGGIYPVDQRVSPAAYSIGRHLWREHIAREGNNGTFLRNAAEYMMKSDRELAMEFVCRGAALEPTEVSWRESLGLLSLIQSLDSTDSVVCTTAIRESLHSYQIALSLQASPDRRFRLTIDAGRVACRAKEFELARAWADSLLLQASALTDSNQTRQGIHYALAMLGHHALSIGQVERAANHLVDAGSIDALFGSGPLFSPDLDLALSLAAIGEREKVLTYVEALETRWKSRKELSNWTTKIRSVLGARP